MDAPSAAQPTLLGRLLRFLFFVFVCAGAAWGGWFLFMAGSNGKQMPAPPRPPVRVTTAEVVRKTIPVEIRAIGNVESYSTVNVKSQVEGELIGVHFDEGQDVKKSDLLFTIDARPFEARLKQAEANLAKDMAQLKNAQADAQRYARLVQQNVVSTEEYNKVQTNADALQAAVSADEAAVVNARLQLEYCRIRSPIDGRTGSLRVHLGNVVKANADTPLVVINQVNPIDVAFAVPEQYLPRIKKYMAAGKLKVLTSVPGYEGRSEEGVVTFLDNAVDTTTGTILLKGTFDNKDRRLWPGQFVDALLLLAETPNAILVPSQAVQNGQEGLYVFVLKPDSTVAYRRVASSKTFGNDAVVEEGLAPGEIVVTDGQLRLVDGAKVEVKQ